MSKRPIYLDYMATTPIDQTVIDEMLKYMGYATEFGNSTSLQHIYGQNAAQAISKSREIIAETIGAQKSLLNFGARTMREEEQMISYGSNYKARETLGWEPGKVQEGFLKLINH